MSASAPSPADVARIVAEQDDVLRNLLITHCYHELALAVRAHTGPGANWCTFATWASKQTGRTIRREDVREALRAKLGGSADIHGRLTALSNALRELRVARDIVSLRDSLMRALDAEAAFERAATAVAVGNRMVFEEIGHAFARYLEVIEAEAASSEPFASSTPTSGEHFAEFLASLRPGEPPHGQTLLREAFHAYHEALREQDIASMSQLLFLANLCIGLHEQTRLQPQIAAALNAAFDADAVRRRLVAQLLPGAWRRVRHRITALFGRRPPLDEAIDRLLADVQRELRRVVTATVMTLHFPGDIVVRLGRDLTASFPPGLTTLTHARLLELLRRIDPTPDSVVGSGAVDWAALDERMHLITDLFRCYHEAESLFEPPFTATQVEALRAGTRPAGAL